MCGQNIKVFLDILYAITTQIHEFGSNHSALAWHIHHLEAKKRSLILNYSPLFLHNPKTLWRNSSHSSYNSCKHITDDHIYNGVEFDKFKRKAEINILMPSLVDSHQNIHLVDNHPDPRNLHHPRQ